MDWRFLAGGIALLAIGISMATVFGTYVTSGPLEELNQNRAMSQFGGIISGIGVLLVLVSFGFSRRKRGSEKGTHTKPNEPS